MALGASLGEVLDRLRAAPPEQPLVFESDGLPIRPGYHVTEFRTATLQGIDCGGRRSDWREAELQLLDGARGRG